MCGITGFLSGKNEPGAADFEGTVQRMAQALRHRGPDDGGAWVDREAGVALGFRRLAILDVSARGHQPMFSADGRYAIVFNGEIYNFKELRTRLDGLGHKFSSGTDTEVILATAVEWGAGEVPAHLQGMFAYAIWDRQQRVLHLARDRMGIKPLYYGWSGDTFLFGSELRALGQYPGFDGTINLEALELYLDFGYVPTPLSIYAGIQKPPPATALQLRAGESHAEPRPYWDLESVFRPQPWEGPDQEAIEKLENLLRFSVERHMISDVPLGALLSGGIDSSAVVAMMCAKARARVKTFSVGFAEKGFDESQHARSVAAHLGTDHTELLLTPQDALEVIPKLPEIYDEPFADSSQIPAFLVSRLARTQVTVALTGDGGDELFGGYNRYLYAPKIWRAVTIVPEAVRSTAAGALTATVMAMRRHGLAGPAADKAVKAAGALRTSSLTGIYWGLCRTQYRANGIQHPIEAGFKNHKAGDPVTDLMYLDILTYLPDDILTKVDRASMAVSLEARVPLLDDRLVQFAASLPPDLKIRGRQTKWLLRQVLYKHVPRAMIERPKAGFAIPLAAWLRGPLSEWAGELLSEEALRDQNLLRRDAVRSDWIEFRAGNQANHHRIWALLMFQAWRKYRRESRPEPMPEPPAGRRNVRNDMTASYA
jgi:asparagine synthase (glutamine-hydrolysing)